mgnify:CR=1 FL=1
MSQGESLQEAPLTEIKDFRSPDNGKAYFFTTSDKIRIRIGIWNTGSIKGTIILQSGRTEFIEKYYEVINEFLERGFCVAMFDWRGQGLSDRLIKNPYIGHIGNFSFYDQELQEIIKSVYTPRCPKPWIGMGHSMGGCLVASTATNYPNIFNLIILCSPMLSLKISKPMELLGLAIGEISRLGFRNSGFLQPEWKQRKGWHEMPFSENVVTSDEGRFNRGANLIKSNKNLALGGASLAWVHESIKRTRQIASPGWGKRITSPTLLLNASDDKLVDSKKNKLICQSIPNINVVEIEGQHELLMEKDTIRKATWKEIDKFIEKNL